MFRCWEKQGLKFSTGRLDGRAVHMSNSNATSRLSGWLWQYKALSLYPYSDKIEHLSCLDLKNLDTKMKHLEENNFKVQSKLYSTKKYHQKEKAKLI